MRDKRAIHRARNWRAPSRVRGDAWPARGRGPRIYQSGVEKGRREHDAIRAAVEADKEEPSAEYGYLEDLARVIEGLEKLAPGAKTAGDDEPHLRARDRDSDGAGVARLALLGGP